MTNESTLQEDITIINVYGHHKLSKLINYIIINKTV